jgi:hypothetical protein
MATNLTNCPGSTEQLRVRHEGLHPWNTGEFDLSTYASFYTGHSKTARLKHIADSYPPLADEALKQLVAALQAHGNMKDFEDLLTGPHRPSLAKLGLDNAEWISECRKTSNVTIGKLEHALRESGDNHAAARAAYINLGDIYYSIGELAQAKKDYYQHALEHGLSLEEDGGQYRDWCLKMVKTSLNNIGASFNMNVHLTKAKSGAGPAKGSMMEASKGLSSLVQASKGLRGGVSCAHDGQLKAAADCFRRTTVDMD